MSSVLKKADKLNLSLSLSPLRASYGMSFVIIMMKNDRVIKGFYCTVSKDIAL